MREILFRGKPMTKSYGLLKRDSDGWIYGLPVPVKINAYMTNRIEIVHCHGYDELDYYELLSEDEEVIPETVGQFTGLLDKNGKKIFEGDIIKTLCQCPEVVEFRDGGFWPFVIKGWECEIDPDEYEVIGNVYDNPGLMKDWYRMEAPT